MSIHPACDDLTPRQYRLWEFIRFHSLFNGKTPTYREMMEFMGNSSPNAIYCLIERMELKGYLKRETARKRFKNSNGYIGHGYGRTGLRLRCREVSLPVGVPE